MGKNEEIRKIAKIGEMGEMGGSAKMAKMPKMPKYPKIGFLGKYPKIEILATTMANTQGRLDVIIILKTTPGSSLNGCSYPQLFLTIL